MVACLQVLVLVENSNEISDDVNIVYELPVRVCSKVPVRFAGLSISEIWGRNSAPFPKPKSMFFPNSR